MYVMFHIFSDGKVIVRGGLTVEHLCSKSLGNDCVYLSLWL